MKGGIDKYCPVGSVDNLTGVLVIFKQVDPVGLALLTTLAPLFNVASSNEPADPEFFTIDDDIVSKLYQIVNIYQTHNL